MVSPRYWLHEESWASAERTIGVGVGAAGVATGVAAGSWVFAKVLDVEVGSFDVVSVALAAGCFFLPPLGFDGGSVGVGVSTDFALGFAEDLLFFVGCVSSRMGSSDVS